MPGQRTYADVCGIARALDVVGERWSLLILRELVLGPKRFTDLRTSLPAIGPDMLTLRLKELAEAGLVEKREIPPPLPVKVYQLTDQGAAIEPVLTALGRFGAALPVSDPEAGMSFDAHILSFRTMFAQARPATRDYRVQLELDGREFRAVVEDGSLTFEPGSLDRPQARVTGTVDAVLAVAHGRRPLEDAQAAGELTLSGDSRAARAFLALFQLSPNVLAACLPGPV